MGNALALFTSPQAFCASKNSYVVRSDLLISAVCDWRGAIANLSGTSMRSTRKAGWRRALRGRIGRIL